MIHRDQKTKAIINDDVAALNKYKMERENHRKVQLLGEELSDIKRTLSKLCKAIEKMENR